MSKKKKKMFVAGCIKDYLGDDRRTSFEKVVNDHKDVVCVSQYDLFSDEIPRKTNRINMINELVKCDSLYLMTGWVHSDDCRTMEQIAEYLGIERIYEGC